MEINFIDKIFSIGSLGKNYSEDFVSNVLVDKVVLSNTTNGVRIKSWQVFNTLFLFYFFYHLTLHIVISKQIVF